VAKIAITQIMEEKNMHIKKNNGFPSVQDVKKGMKVIVFGKYEDMKFPFYFAFLAPEETPLKYDTSIEGLVYAEGTTTRGDFKIIENINVTTYRDKNGGYLIKKNVQGTDFWEDFIFQHKFYGNSTHQTRPVRLISMRLS